MHETPAAANVLRKTLAGLMDQAIRLEWRTDNPVRFTDSYAEGEGFHDWTDDEIDQYRAKHPLGSMARLTLELALNTAARRCNVNKIERDHVKNGRITVAHVKGNNDPGGYRSAARCADPLSGDDAIRQAVLGR